MKRHDLPSPAFYPLVNVSKFCSFEYWPLADLPEKYHVTIFFDLLKQSFTAIGVITMQQRSFNNYMPCLSLLHMMVFGTFGLATLLKHGVLR